MVTATRSIFPTTARTLCAAGCGGSATVYVARLSCTTSCAAKASCTTSCVARLSCTTSRSRRRLMSLCVSNALSLFTVPSPRHDVQPRVCAIHDALIVPLFAAIYRINSIYNAYKGYIEIRPPRHASEKMLGWCQEVADPKIGFALPYPSTLRCCMRLATCPGDSRTCVLC